MRDQLWNLLYDVHYRAIYARRYNAYARNVEESLSVLSLVVTASSVAGWSIWQQFPVVWSVIIACVQVLNLCRPSFPFSRRLVSLRFYIPEIDLLALDMEHYWNQVIFCDSSQAPADILARHRCFNESLCKLEAKYFGSDLLPDMDKIAQKSQKECDTYFQRAFLAKINEE